MRLYLGAVLRRTSSPSTRAGSAEHQIGKPYQRCGPALRPGPFRGQRSSSPEEANCVRDLVDEILGSGTIWIDKNGEAAPVTLIIAPYNAQVFELQDRIPGGRIGTVDKFQGQEAPIVIYSMTTSSYADAPRGMEFLYSLNRLNVATSHAKCICVLVASPSVFEAQCRTPRQMQLANAFCRYLERASVIRAVALRPEFMREPQWRYHPLRTADAPPNTEKIPATHLSVPC